MLTRLGQYADKVIEYGWLAAAVFAPLFFNVYSSRVFEPDKISTLRSIVLVMLLAWIIKLLEGGVRAYSQSEATTRAGKLQDAVGGAAERGLPSWLGFLRVPMILPILVYALAYLISSIFTVSPEATWAGSYQRLQGTYTQYSYMLLGIMVIANLRTRTQLERLINFMILTSVPVVLYGFVQASPLLDPDFKLDPLPWAGDTATRVASTMGNAIFVAAWIIMVVPLTLYRLFNGISAAIEGRKTEDERRREADYEDIEEDEPIRSPQRRTSSSGLRPSSREAARPSSTDSPSHGWVTASIGLGIIFIFSLIFYATLKVMAGLPFPDPSGQRMAWLLPAAIMVFFLGCLGIEYLGRNRISPSNLALYMPMLITLGLLLPVAGMMSFPFGWGNRDVMVVQENSSLVVNALTGDVRLDLGTILAALLMLAVAAAVIYWAARWLRREEDNHSARMYAPFFMGLTIFIIAAIAIPLDWSLARVLENGQPTNNLLARLTFDPGRLLWVLFIALLWGAISAGIYTLASGERVTNRDETESPIVRSTLNVGYGLLLALQLLCVYLTQSRGPWLGLGAGLVTFAVAMWLVGRQRNVRWMTRFGGSVSAVVLVLAVFVIVLNIPGSPLRALTNLPLVGRGIERLSTLTRTEDGTGKVRTLIWQGATDLILSDPVRALIGWGPEAMYVAYNPHYPAELARWELRNATPDRSHNVEFDQLVTMGVLGLLAYYLVVGAFFYYAMRILKRLSTTRDQLMLIALISAMVAHFIEIQTGIQIASTWTYFYLLIAMMVAFGFYINNYLRPATALAGGPQTTDHRPLPAAEEARRGVETARAARNSELGTRNSATVAANAPSGRKERTGSTTIARESARESRRQTTNPQSAIRNPQSRSSSGVRRVSSDSDRPWFSPEPWKLVLYVLLALVVWTVNFGFGPLNLPGINSATVRADSLYKVGLQYDQSRLWPQSIDLYKQAIELQPTQDYYYLFLGRSWLEFSKQVDQERAGTALVDNVKQSIPNWPSENANWRMIYARFLPNLRMDVTCQAPEVYASEADRETERLCRLRQSEYVLNKAHELNPLNTDHFANRGRLYLYWADASGGKDPSKTKLAIQQFERAVERTPGNAQLWDELGVAYSRDGQFSKAVETFEQAFKVDDSYARTPFLLAQILQERIAAVRAALQNNQAPPTGGETDLGKLLLSMGEAYSASILLDPSQFVDASYEGRIDYILSESQALTQTNTTLPHDQVRNVLTSTVTVAFETAAERAEKSLADYLRDQGAFPGSEEQIPTAALQSLLQDNRWSETSSTGQRVWTDSNFTTITRNAILSYQALGSIYRKTGQIDRAKQVLDRALLLDPANTTIRDAREALGQ